MSRYINVDMSTSRYETKCANCNHPLFVPIKHGYDNPAFVMEIERRQYQMRDEIIELRRRLIELAGECVAAGVKPTILREADEMKNRFNELLERLEEGIE